jgi:hypothetical protein
MDARRGLAPQRALLSLITANLGLEFSTRMLHVALAPNTAPVEVALHYRKLDDVASFLFRFVAPEHCRPRELVDPVTGGRVYSDPYTGTYLNKLHRRLRQRDPTAIMLALKLYWDPTNLTKNGERTACPVSVSCLALPLEVLREHASSLLLAYFSKLPESVMAELSEGKKTVARKALHRAQMRALFDGVEDQSMVALCGRRAYGAHGAAENVYPVILGLSLDYVKIAEATQTLQNEGCWMCYARKGYGFWSNDCYELRTVKEARHLIGKAWARHPHSATRRKEQLRPYSLHPDPNPCFDAPGLEVFQGTAVPLMHLTWHGVVPKLVEQTFTAIQRQISRIDFRRLGERIDSWVATVVVPGRWTKTGFKRGFSHYLYGAYFDATDPWASTVKFGQIASKDVMRDICRFWRMLIVDLFPEEPKMLDLYTDYFDWLEMVYWRAHTDESLSLVASLNEQWKELAIDLFGKGPFELMIKFHAGVHIVDWTRARGSLLHVNDENGEAMMGDLAKEPWEHTNRHYDPELQMVNYVERRDVLKLLLRVRAASKAATAPAGLPAAPPVVNGTPAVLMAARPRFSIQLAAAAATSPELAQLPFAISLFLHLAAPGNTEDVPYPAGMPSLTSDALRVHPAVTIHHWPRSFLAAERGGKHLYAAFHRGANGRLVATGAPPTFVAVMQEGGVFWYGVLVLCFVAHYMQDEELCYVRWLDTVEMRARLERRQLTPSEQAEPFDAFRWSTQPGSRRIGHPRAGEPHYGVVSCSSVRYRVPMIPSILDELGAADPLFRLNTDMYRFGSS